MYSEDRLLEIVYEIYKDYDINIKVVKNIIEEFNILFPVDITVLLYILDFINNNIYDMSRNKDYMSKIIRK